MSQHSPRNVIAAYEMLQEEVEAEIALLNSAGAGAFASGDHTLAQEFLARVTQFATLRDDLREWGTRLAALAGESAPQAVHGVCDGVHDAQVKISHGPRRATTTRVHRARAGARTPEEAYRIPILSALVEMGGGGETSRVLDRVYQLVKDRLTDHDRALLNSRSNTPRWRNSAQWCRKKLCDEGLMRSDSPFGVWQISDEGRRWLAAHDRDA